MPMTIAQKSHQKLLSAAFLTLLLATPHLAWAQKNQPNDLDDYQATMSALERGSISGGLTGLQRIESPLLRKVALGTLMAQPDTPYDFKQLSSFISSNPSWPELAEIQKRAEEKLPPEYSAEQIIHWCQAHPPLTLAGFNRMIAALRSTGANDQARNLIRARWVDGSFGSVEQEDFLKKYRSDLRASDHWDRLDRLLWENTEIAALRMLPLVSKGQTLLAKARMSMARRDIDRVPAALRHDPGLVYLQLKQARQDDKDAKALSLLSLQPQHPRHQEDLWWTERSIIARRYLVNGQHSKAYQIAARHKLDKGMSYHQAEFLAGWIALRFLHQTETARKHFHRIYDESSYPISKARGAYWLGRSYAAQKSEEQAAAWYAKAAVYPTTFYGQLAQAALDADATLTLAPPSIDPDDRRQFTMHDNVRIAALLEQIGERKRAESFIMALAKDATSHTQFALLAQWATKLERYELAVRISKLAVKRGFMLDNEAYPVPAYQLRDEPEQALVLGLIRQESMFNPTIVSPAQAQGLMQLLPSTARAEARKLDISFSPSRLYEPNYNIRLGSRFLADRIEQFDGALILAIASYNAGPTRVRQWMEKIGDPRNGVDPIDWIELIPVYETRNYVHRVLEATQIYRARLRQGSSKLKIIQDIESGKRS